MWQLTVALLLSACLSVMAFKAMPQAFRASSHLNERFNLDFGNPKIETSPLIFTEKQLREYTAEYAEDVRMNPIEAVINLFKADGKGYKVSAKPKVVAPVVAAPKVNAKAAAKGKFSPPSFSLPSISLPKISFASASKPAAPKTKKAAVAKSAVKSAVKISTQATGGTQNGARKTIKIR